MGNLGCGQTVARVARVRLAVRAHQVDALARHRVVAGPVSRVVAALRVVPVAVTLPVQANHAQRLGVMTGSPRVRQRTSHVWALQSLREATAKPPWCDYRTFILA